VGPSAAKRRFRGRPPSFQISDKSRQWGYDVSGFCDPLRPAVRTALDSFSNEKIIYGSRDWGLLWILWSGCGTWASGSTRALFGGNDIDDTVLLTLTAEKLKELGVTSFGHRRKLVDAIAVLRSPEDGKTLPTEVTATTASMGPRHRVRHWHSSRICDARHHWLRGTLRLRGHWNGI